MFPNPDNWITGNWGEDSVPEEDMEYLSLTFDTEEDYDAWRALSDNKDWWLDYSGLNDEGKFVVDLSKDK